MELKDFIKRTVHEAMDAIIELNTERIEANKIGRLNMKVTGQEEFESDIIEFDVAVTAGTTQHGGAEGGINVVGFTFGADGKIERENANVSRVKFSLDVVWPFVGVTDVKKLARSGRA